MCFDNDNRAVNQTAYYEAMRLDSLAINEPEQMLDQLPELLKQRHTIADIIRREPRQPQKDQAKEMLYHLESIIKKVLIIH